LFVLAGRLSFAEQCLGGLGPKGARVRGRVRKCRGVGFASSDVNKATIWNERDREAERRVRKLLLLLWKWSITSKLR